MTISKYTNEELKLIFDAVIANIKYDFLRKSVSYVSTSDLRCIGLYLSTNDLTYNNLKGTVSNKTIINRFLKRNLNAVSVSVGNKQMAVVKRKD